jgi:hypothetical protein
LAEVDGGVILDRLILLFLPHGAQAMTITVEATYENGQLKFKGPVSLAQGTTVRVTITPLDQDYEVPPAPIRDHSAFLTSYAPEDEGLYHAYPPR